MSVSKFKFVSPGVQIAEIDNSQLPKLPDEVGPVIFGRAERGPGLRPVKIDSFSDFVNIFGTPKAGGMGEDVWRNGGAGLSPTYGVYAAQAYLRNSSPLTFVRLLGTTHPDATNPGGRAGWASGDIDNQGTDTGGAYGLFVTQDASPSTGTLAATFYMTEGTMMLKADELDGTENSGSCAILTAQDDNWKMEVRDGSGNLQDTISFNFDENSKSYIRKVFNTNPTLTNGTIFNSTKTYWLGESFDRMVADASIGSNPLGLLLPMTSGSATQYEQNLQLRDATKAETPWIFSQDLAGDSGSFNPQNLFQLKTLDAGEWEQKNLKVSIADVKSSDDPDVAYGTFTVELRYAKDSDNARQIVERFSLCNLNPNSNNYVAKKIGDMYAIWDYNNRRYREYGSNVNRSKYVYVVMNSEVDAAATNEQLLPMGFRGPIRWNTFNVTSGSANEISPTEVFVTGGIDAADGVIEEIRGTGRVHEVYFGPGGTGNSYAFEFPKVPLRSSTLEGKLSSPKDAYFGADTTMPSSTRFERSYQDVVRAIGDYRLDATGDASNAAQSYSYVFTMEDITTYTNGSFKTTSSTDVYYISGSRASGDSLATNNTLGGYSTGSWNNVLKSGFRAFTVPLHGGFDGIDIAESEPWRNSQWASNGSETTSAPFNSLKIAIDSCADPEVVETNMMSVPGITNTALTEHLIKVCEDRADALAVIDIEGGYIPPAESFQSEQNRAGSVSTAVNSLSQRGINSSYGCCYYPWVQSRDSETGKTFWCPPSVAAVGTFSSSQNKSEIWFAPAGFTRGGLSEGAAGIPIINVKQKLTSKERDDLYEVNINPIASFPAEGIVMFGQKTLQTTAIGTWTELMYED